MVVQLLLRRDRRNQTSPLGFPFVVLQVLQHQCRLDRLQCRLVFGNAALLIICLQQELGRMPGTFAQPTQKGDYN
jgi:hypothetical protein